MRRSTIEPSPQQEAEPGTNIYWAKLTDPDAEVPDLPPDTDVRVLLPDEARFTTVAEKLRANGAQVRHVRHLAEQEVVTDHPDRTYQADAYRDSGYRESARPDREAGSGELVARSSECHLTRAQPRVFPEVREAEATAAREAFDLAWETHAPPPEALPERTPVHRLVPPDWQRFLPYPEFNPAQAQAVPHILGDAGSDDPANPGNLVIVAPTGAGKTVVGMVAALRAVREQGRKAAWLVPQRSLTDELDRELEVWRREGLRVERLSGEYSVDVQRVREADLWVATTEKFEAICRASSLREALAEVGCLIVDEIHLLGDPERGPVLEALLARMRTAGSGPRIVGLSATVSNAGEVAEWLHAKLLRVTWRPSRLTWQLPVVASNRDWSLVETARIRLASAITATVTRDGGSVLVFCGSKRGVRRTALVIAASRGADTGGVHPDDEERLAEVCRAAGVGLHYKGWEHKREAEQDFRAHRLDVLVATSTVAAGVNLPARAVVVQDTDVGLSPIDVATVQQMFGRAGRIGAGENEGWAFLIVTEQERPGWQARLVAGHRVRSRIQSSLPDHVLAEAVQQRIACTEQAERWWVGTLAHHQGSSSLAPLRRAVDFLTGAGFLTSPATPGEPDRFVPTELGKLTARLMVPTVVGHDLRTGLADAALPENPEEAESCLIGLVSTLVPKLAQTAINEDVKTAVTRVLGTGGHGEYQPGQLAQTALLLVAGTPQAFHRGARTINGIPYMAMYPVLEEAPRYLHWIGCQGLLGTVHPWSAIVAGDLGRRVRWRRCQPRRGAGRLLWICEQMATAAALEDLVPQLWTAATGRGITAPDWTATGMPRHCRLDAETYQALLRDRAGQARIEVGTDRVAATGPEGAVLAVWSGTRHAIATLNRGTGSVARPDDAAGALEAAVFTRRGDHRATGWLSEYSVISGTSGISGTPGTSEMSGTPGTSRG